jgi:hypothetical protein
VAALARKKTGILQYRGVHQVLLRWPMQPFIGFCCLLDCQRIFIATIIQGHFLGSSHDFQLYTEQKQSI